MTDDIQKLIDDSRRWHQPGGCQYRGLVIAIIVQLAVIALILAACAAYIYSRAASIDVEMEALKTSTINIPEGDRR
jgi:hypothetical protein